jgi:hypothetical protein
MCLMGVDWPVCPIRVSVLLSRRYPVRVPRERITHNDHNHDNHTILAGQGRDDRRIPRFCQALGVQPSGTIVFPSDTNSLPPPL